MTDNKDNCKCANHYYDKKPKLKLQSQTTNKATYKPLPIQKQTQFEIPKVVQKHYDPQVMQTSYKSQYNKPVVTPQSTTTSINPKQSYLKNKPHIPFYSDTSYKDSYKPQPIVVEKQPVYQYKSSGTKFEGESSYKSSFQPKQNTDLIKQTTTNTTTAQDYINRKPKIQFQGSSSYKDTFKQHQVKTQKQPQYKYSKNPNKFQGQSSYKQTFKQPPKQSYKVDNQYCPVHPGKVALK